MKQIFLESHNIKNQFSGLGQFNYHLIKGLYESAADDLKFVVHSNINGKLKNDFGDYFKYLHYYSFTRYKALRLPFKYDLWHSLNQNTKIEPRFNMPYVMTVHDVHFAEGTDSGDKTARIKRFQEKLNRAHALVYISKFAQTATKSIFDTSNHEEHVIYNGNPMIDTSIPVNFEPNFKPNKPYLFTIGEFTERKNFHSLIEMLQFLPDYELIIAGNSERPYLEKIKQVITANKLESRVHIPGKISETEKKYHLKNCAAFVFPSLKEGFGIPIIEALRFGTPVITSNNTSLPEVGGTYATYWEHYAPEYMAKKLLQGITRFNADTQLKQDAIAHAKSFNWNNTAKAYLKVYRSVLNK
ncbi:glycosyltransferase family 4 protein [Leeuwenhoekiella marinoflava]|uniref:Glycosyltransferase involved in cell wall biosynthesis n=2 Tax=Leeuwenhoekiella marinoflava TaxID=988 RepID=A0A4Q0PQ83_9FLAO|nr:glycosyltransferase family 1 protein [Leeuwenhoekiella marinoflava]RXG32657.1 glycosyltransferase involved in cell wall biosynthesis [Leeuwenhoekiella marinoflava]SHE52368.1 Glycosyltransferase involved in cell wall bisynthesis [Leeuwenhoekiella marinoflava DSM 3653]